MNIYIPHNWLLEHLNTKATPHEISKYLSLCGPSVERIEQIEGEPVYDIEVTTNRVDMMSVRGIAREAAAILPEFGIEAKLIPLDRKKMPIKGWDKGLDALDIKIVNDSELCHRILALKISGVELGESPLWLQKRLIQVGQRPLNNVVDITNYVMWELGHPIHAFDYDRLNEKNVIVREAQKGESFITLDGKSFECIGGEVVFDDGTGEIIDLPGIMGTTNTVVTDKTENVLLWIESIVARKIRFASMSHAIRSQAAVLNEKHVDPELGKNAILRGLHLFEEMTGGYANSYLYDEYSRPHKPNQVSLTQKNIDTYLGIEIQPVRVKRILENLGCEVITHKKTETKYLVTPPSYRARDIQIKQDVIEEIARIYGYHNLPSVVMDTPIPDNPDGNNFALEFKIKQWLAGWGAQEIYTYSMVSKEIALKSNDPLKDHVTIANPLTDELVYMRRTLLPSLAQVLDENPSAKTTVFELQNVYRKRQAGATSNPKLPVEKLSLGIMSNLGYQTLKGVVDGLMDRMYISEYSIEPVDDVSGKIMFGKKSVGIIGQFEEYHAAEIDARILIHASSSHPTHVLSNTYPPIIEDLTFTLPKQAYIQPIMQEMHSASQLIESVSLKDVYQQNHTFCVTYRSEEKNLTDKDVEPIRKKIVVTLEKVHQAILVGTLD